MQELRYEKPAVLTIPAGRDRTPRAFKMCSFTDAQVAALVRLIMTPANGFSWAIVPLGDELRTRTGPFSFAWVSTGNLVNVSHIASDGTTSTKVAAKPLLA